MHKVRKITEKRWEQVMKNKLKKIDKKLWNCKAYRFLVCIPRKGVHTYKAIKKLGFSGYWRDRKIKICMKFGKKEPLVSVVMPVYNTEKYLRQAIDSLLEQSVKQIEIIAVDDGSTDTSLQILREYEKADQRVHVFTQKNQHAGAARNLGLSHAKGEYVIFLDSDDFFDKDLIKDTYYHAKMKDADVVLFGGRHYDDQSGRTWVGDYLLDAKSAPKVQPFNCKDCPDKIFQITSACPWTKLFRRKFIESTGLRFQTIHNANDVFFILSAITMAERIVTLDKQYVNYRVGLKDNLQSSKKRYFFEAYYAWHDQLKKIGMLDILRKSYVNCAMNGCLYNLRAVRDLEAKRAVFERLKKEAFEYLEITGYPADDYYDQRNYREMLRVQTESFEQYLQ